MDYDGLSLLLMLIHKWFWENEGDKFGIVQIGI